MSMRFASRAAGILAYLPAAIVWYVTKTDAAYRVEHPCIDCGMVTLLVVWLPGLVATAILGAIALWLGIVAYRGQPVPRSLGSRIELSLVTLPAFATVVIVLALLIGVFYISLH